MFGCIHALCTGRVAQLLEQEAINIDDLDLLVLDEADKLLTGSFVQQIEYVRISYSLVALTRVVSNRIYCYLFVFVYICS